MRPHILQQHFTTPLAHFARGGAHVWREHHIVHLPQLCGNMRLVGKYIECRAGDLLVDECGHQRGFIDYRAA